MKRFKLGSILLIFSIFLVGAAFAPKKFSKVVFTKSVTYSLKNLNGITIVAFSNISAKLNGKGESWPISANSAQDLGKFRNISTVTFYGSSSATQKTVKIQEY